MTTEVRSPRRATAVEKPRVRKILTHLAKEYPEPRCALRYSNPLQLLVATVLSAQCTDARVNQVTAQLFLKYRTAAEFAAASLAELEAAIRSTGFYRNKARAIHGFCTALVRDHEGEVPCSMEALVALPGVGRKTANLVLSEAFGVAGIVVDTHVARLSQRLGLTQRTDPDKIEQDLLRVVPKDQWSAFSLRLILHGRQVCKARRPLCHQCALLNQCPTGVSRV